MAAFRGCDECRACALNGRQLATHLGGYLPFTVDLTDALNFTTTNELTVQLDNRDNAITGPKPLKILDFNTYGGLYRDAALIVKDPVHITDEIMEALPGSGGVFVTFPQVAPDKATLAVKDTCSQRCDSEYAPARRADAAVRRSNRRHCGVRQSHH